MTIRKFGALAALLTSISLAGACNSGDSDPAAPAVDAFNTSGYLTRFAGTGIDGLGPDGLAPDKTDLSKPMDLTIESATRSYIVDWNNHRIRKIANGVTTTVVGSGYIGDATDGQGSSVNLNHPTHVVVEADGNLLYAAWHNSKVQRLNSTTGAVTNVAGTGSRLIFGGDGGEATKANLDLPAAVALKKGGGGFYIMDQANQVIRFVNTSVSPATISTIAGTAKTAGYDGDGGQATAAKMHQPVGQSAPPAGRLVVDKDGNLVFADSSNHVVRKIDTTTGIITTIAGTGTQKGHAGDGGTATSAKLNRPSDVAIDSDGNLFIADTDNHCVREVDAATGKISTVVGTGGVFGYAGEGKKGTEALLDQPHGVEVDAAGNLYIVDTFNSRILRLKK